jgi:acylphosphatase
MVRNRADGSVEVVAEGAGDSIDGFLEWLHRGPPGSWVRDVQALEIPWTGHYEDFDVEF